MTYTISLRGQKIAGETLADISRAYGDVRDRSDEGASTFPYGVVRVDGGAVGFMSYNGKVWEMATDAALDNHAADESVVTFLNSARAMLDLPKGECIFNPYVH